MTTRALALTGLTLATGGVVYGALGIERGASLFAWLAAWFAVVAWLPHDAARHHVPLVTDWRWFIALGWPVLGIWYARRTGRGWWAALGLAALSFAFQLGTVVGSLIRGTVS